MLGWNKTVNWLRRLPKLHRLGLGEKHLPEPFAALSSRIWPSDTETKVIPPDEQTGGSPPEPAQPASSSAATSKSLHLRRLSQLRWPQDGIKGVWSRMAWKWRFAIVLPFASAAVAVLALVGSMVYYTIAYPHPLARQAGDTAAIKILGRDGTVIGERDSERPYTPVEELPRHLQAAVVATEDRRFFDHFGLDPVGLARAFFANLRAGRFVQGGSTLTQQLAKNLFLSSERTLSRKLEELAVALWLEMRLSKPEILELYLNSVYFGAGAYGVEMASQRYFDRPARDLTLPQSAVIAGLLKAPSRYAPSRNPRLARARGRVVIRAMRDAGFITEAEAHRALAERVVFAGVKTPQQSSVANYAIDYVRASLTELDLRSAGPLIIETTLDADLQRRAGEIMQQSLERDGPRFRAGQGAVVVLDHDGGVRAMVGGRDYAKSQFNRAVSAQRQPGSVFKPIVYAAAFDDGLTPDSPIIDIPVSYDGWSPSNVSGGNLGLLTMRSAMARSVNTVAAVLHHAAGPGRTVATARRMGITSPLRDEPSLALGTSEVSPLEIATAYAVLGNGGHAVEPHVIRRVRAADGTILYTRSAIEARRVLAAPTVRALTDVLTASVQSGTGKRAALSRHAVAGKTGTTQDYRDAWFAGYSNYLAAAVWIGNDDGAPMRKAAGSGLPADLWRRVMSAGHEALTPIAFPSPPETTQDHRLTAYGPVAAHVAQLVAAYKRDPKALMVKLGPSAGDGNRQPKESIPDEFFARALSGTVDPRADVSGLTDSFESGGTTAR